MALRVCGDEAGYSDELASAPLPVPQLAAAVGAHEDSLRRVLRLLADHGIVTLENDLVACP